MRRIPKEQSTYTFAKEVAPVLRVQSGEQVQFETFDCFSNQVTSEANLVTDIDFSQVNPATGLVYVEGAAPGDVLRVQVDEVSVREWGVIATLPGMGVLIHTVDELRTKIVPIEASRVAHFNERIHFPVDPMIGVIGVAPAGDGVPCGLPGDHGGNIDCHVITRGSTVYFPVNVEGALFGLGDVHASMGDGEICGTGIEIAGVVDATLSVLKETTIRRPIVETADAWYTVASADNLELAIRRCSEDMQRLLIEHWELSATDAFFLMSVAGDVQMCQCCKPCPIDVIARFRIPKFDGMPRLIG